MKKLLPLIFIFTAYLGQAQTTYYVDAAQSDNTGDGLSWATAKKDLQNAIDAAAVNDIIWLKSGTYLPTEKPDGVGGSDNRDFAFHLDKDLEIYGGFDGTETAGYDLSLRNFLTNETILSGNLGSVGSTSDNAYHVIISVGQTTAATIDGFSIQDGHANKSSNTITYATKTIMANRGAGVLLDSSSPSIKNCVIKNNNAAGTNGADADYSSTPATQGTAAYGGGLYATTAVLTIENTLISNNKATGGNGGSTTYANKNGANGGEAFGGGLFLTSTSSLSLLNVIIHANESRAGLGSNGSNGSSYETGGLGGNGADALGGGIYADGSSLALTNTVITNNINIASRGGNGGRGGDFANGGNAGNGGDGLGGGIYSSAASSFSIVNSTIVDNNTTKGAGGIAGQVGYNGSSAGSAGTTGLANGGGLYIENTTPSLLNTIIRENNGDSGEEQISNQSATPSISYSNIEGSGGSGSWVAAIGTDGGNNIDADPLFKDSADPDGLDNLFFTADDGLNTSDCSTLLDIGTTTGTSHSTDILGNAFIANIDMGAYENQKLTDGLPLVTGTTDATICENEMANLAVTVNHGIPEWYAAETGGNPLITALTYAPNLLTTTEYWVLAKNGACEAASRVKVTGTVSIVSAPTGDASQSFCPGFTVADLVATGTGIKWYDAPTNGNLLLGTDALVDGTNYYASQTVTGCESFQRLSVTVTVFEAPDAPIAAVSQAVCSAADLNAFQLIGSDLKWYDAASAGTLLTDNTPIISGTSYFASQTVNGCESLSRTEVSTSTFIAFPDNRIYVNHAATAGSNDGTSWANAFTDLQPAITAAAGCPVENTIWVAQGTYLPTVFSPGNEASPDNREKSFLLINDVKLYGGFLGTETMLTERDFETNTTILSGDLGVLSNTSDNAYHVLITSNLSEESIINGFTIENGNANASDSSFYVGPEELFANYGGGLVNYNSTLKLKNLTIRNNTAQGKNGTAGMSVTAYVTNGGNGTSSTAAYGAGMYNVNSTIEIDSSLFENNQALGGNGGNGGNAAGSYSNGGAGTSGSAAYGAALYNINTSLNINGSSYLNNQAKGGNGGRGGNASGDSGDAGAAGNGQEAYGGAIYNNSTEGDTLIISNTTFSQNKSIGGNGGDGGDGNYPADDGGNGGNGSNAYGGAIYNHSGIYSQIEETKLISNNATGGTPGDGGQGLFSDGNPGVGGNALGGAIYNAASSFSIEKTVFESNSSYGTDGKSSDFFGYFNSGYAKGGAIFNTTATNNLINKSYFVNNITRGGRYGSHTAGGGGAIWTSNSVDTLRQVVFSGNVAQAQQRYSYGYNNMNGAAINAENATVLINNNTFSKNALTTISSDNISDGKVLYATSNSIVDINNSNMWGNTGYSSRQNIRVSSATVTLKNTNSEGQSFSANSGTDGGGNIDLDPRFVNANDPDGADNLYFTADDGLALQECSPAIDAGDSTLLGNVPLDMVGLNRFLTTNYAPQATANTVDIGAYENQVLDAVSPPTVNSVISRERCGIGTLNLNASPSSGATIVWYDSLSNDTKLYTGSSFTTPSLSKTNYYYAEAINGSCTSLSRTEVKATVYHYPDGHIYVDTNATGSEVDGTTWEYAYPNLQAAFNRADACFVDTIWVAQGTYYPTESPNGVITDVRQKAFHFNSNHLIYGGFNGTETMLSERNWDINKTILSGDFNDDDGVTGLGSTLNISGNNENAYHVLTLSGQNQNTLLDGFTIKGGNANSPSGNMNFRSKTFSHSTGGGIYLVNASPKFNNLSITENYAGFGGGMAIFDNSIPVINTSVLNRNQALYGGAINTNNSTPELYNVTISQNKASDGGGLSNSNNSSIILQNSIIWENSSSNSGPNIISSSSLSLMKNSILQGSGGSSNWTGLFGLDGGNNLDADPLFDNSSDPLSLELEGCSPAIDNGDATNTTNSTDIKGNAFIGNLDIGAYENEKLVVPMLPSVTSAPAQSVCIDGTGLLSVTVSEGTAVWYSTTGTKLFEGLAYQSPIITEDTSFMVEAQYGTCISPSRTAVLVNTIARPAAPFAAASQQFYIAASVSDLAATGSTINWYEESQNGNPLLPTEPLVTGTYYVSQIIGGCESNRTAVNVTIIATLPAPVASAAQTFCNGELVSAIEVAAEGNIKWYDALTGGNEITMGTVLASGNYYAAQTISGIESDRTLVVVTVNAVTPAPTGAATQLACGLSSLSSLDITGTNLKWFDAPTDGIELSPVNSIVDGTDYYISQTIAGCEGPRLKVTATLKPMPPLPTVTSTQAFCAGDSVASLMATGLAITWYDAATDGNMLGSSVVLTDATDYFASQTIDGCESNRVPVSVTINAIPSAPSGAASQTFCEGLLISDIVLTGTGLKWYDSSTLGTVLLQSDSLKNDSTYFASQTILGCESPRTAVHISLNDSPDTPEILVENLTYCGPTTVILSVDTSGYEAGTIFNWTGGLAGESVTVNLTETESFKVMATAPNSCASDSSTTVTVTIFDIPEKPVINADNLTICKGGSAILTGTCASHETFRWETASASQNNTISGLGNSDTRAVTEPGVYRGFCEANGCTGEMQSITILQDNNCSGGEKYITISPSSAVICPGASASFTASGCGGTLTWTGGPSSVTGVNQSFSPVANTTYVVQCSTGGIASFDVTIAETNTNVTQNISTGAKTIKAVNTILSDKKVGDPNFTPAPNITYEAGNSITLLPGFEATKHSVFKAEIKTCP